MTHVAAEAHSEDQWLDHDERRAHPRRRARLRAEARRIDLSELTKRHPRVGLTIANVSAGGLSATTRCPVVVGERFALDFSRTGLPLAGNVVGRVIRCAPQGRAWAVAMQFDGAEKSQ